MRTAVGFIFSLLSCLGSFAQYLPIHNSGLAENWRRAQLEGEKDINKSFCVRPINLNDSTGYNSIFQFKDTSTTDGSVLYSGKKSILRLLPLSFIQQYNSHHPYGWNDGSMIPARGYQSQISGGIYFRKGHLSIQFQPEFVYAKNRDFSTFPTSLNDSIWASYYYVQNRIDNPEKFGSGSYLKFFPGQSSVRLNIKKLSLGVSTENLWWGPGVRNALLMSNNAPGFLHATFNSNAPVLTPVGSFEWQVVSGLLKNTNILPPDTSRKLNGVLMYEPKNQTDRYLNGMVITWQPKWTKGLHLGFSRAFYQYRNNVHNSLNGYLPVLSAFFKTNAENEDSYGRDQLLSIFFRLILPKDQAELYGEFGRNDHSQNGRDLILEPEHARAYLFGFRKIFPQKNNKDVEAYLEIANLQSPSTLNLRALEGWYTHYQVRQGYTNMGQVIGAGIGPGSGSQTLGVNFINGINKTGLMLERIVWNNDFYYNAFAPTRNFGRHWVDLSATFNRSMTWKRFILEASLSLIRSYNYQWNYDYINNKNVDVMNVHSTISIVYPF